ncbi:hypothetical protein ACIRPH_27080 [Nocardiopsis sp. NPDC101807]|uniref:hypothetical protein n=1 Tax=Nocardiopsis sp. NPDC101807 TaxID=3364339 RepID=UPI003802C045
MGIGISILALSISVASFLFNFFYNRSLKKRDLLLSMHQEMISTENQRGRGILVRLAKENREVTELNEEEREAVNHALAQIDVLGYYCKMKYIKESSVIDLWQSSFRMIEPKAEDFAKILDQEKDMKVWPHGRKLLDKARMKRLTR